MRPILLAVLFAVVASSCEKVEAAAPPLPDSTRVATINAWWSVHRLEFPADGAVCFVVPGGHGNVGVSCVKVTP